MDSERIEQKEGEKKATGKDQTFPTIGACVVIRIGNLFRVDMAQRR
jgi:hypothetical protein